MTRALPPSASTAHAQDGAKLHAPSAARNVHDITALLLAHAPATGRALEIASGTGQHICAFANALPALRWHPSEIDTPRLASVDAYVAEKGLKNVAAATHLNATTRGWARLHPDHDLIFLSNLLHLISTTEARTLILEAALALAPNGLLVLYGPFKRAGQLTSAGDQKFDAELRAADPAIGYKDTDDIMQWLTDAGLHTAPATDMPANNLAFIARKAMP